MEKSMIRRRIRSAYFSSVVSISLVLLLVGCASLLLVNTKRVSDYFKEHMNISVLLRPEVGDSDAVLVGEKIEELPFVLGTEYVSREQGKKEMAEILGDDFLSVFETSPVPISYNVTLKPEYVVADSVKVAEKALGAIAEVEEVVWQQSLVDTLNENLRKITLAFGVVIALLLFISFVLISNTMRLCIYDKRFSVHTMKLVGATRGFIRAPFLARAAFLGLVSALLAVIMLVALLYLLKESFAQLFEVFSLDSLLLVIGIVVATGLVICVASTWLVVDRLVSIGKDELYY